MTRKRTAIGDGNATEHNSNIIYHAKQHVGKVCTESQTRPSVYYYSGLKIIEHYINVVLAIDESKRFRRVIRLFVSPIMIRPRDTSIVFPPFVR